MLRWRTDWTSPPAIAFLASLASAAPASAQLAPIEVSAASPERARALRLEVLIHGGTTHLVEPFALDAVGRLSAARADLEEVGIRCDGRGGPRDLIDLGTLPELSYAYDEAHQTVDFELPDSARAPRVYDASAVRIRPPAPEADWGSMLNYTLFASSMDRLRAFPEFEGANATLDARLFGPYGTVRQTAIVGDTVGSRREALRLDTAYRYSDPDTMVTGEAGDVVSGGLGWTRPFRYAGLQVQRDFALRPDLIMQPLPSFSGSATLPSTVDVFLNDARAVSQPVDAGPYSVTNLPLISGGGVAHVVVTDATGQQTEAALPFFATPTLLAPGVADFSAGAGVARTDYGLASDSYGTRPLATGTVRRGITDRLTWETHAEGGAGLVDGGTGVVAGLGPLGLLSGALSGSRIGARHGAQAFAAYDVEVRGFKISASSQRSFWDFDDVGSITASRDRRANRLSSYAAGIYALDARPARALDRLTVGVPLVFDDTSVSASLINLVEADGTRSRIVTASLIRPVPFEGTLFATGYADLTRRGQGGAFIGVSVPLGSRVRASVGGSANGSDRSSTVDVGQILDRTDGSVGWHLHDQEGPTSERGAEAAYRSSYGTAAVNVSQVGGQVAAQGSFEGSVGAIRHGGLFAGNRADDGFAVIDAGVGGVPVYQDNRLVGETNPWGKLLVADLRSYQRNQVSIDALALPSNAEARSTKRIVAPTGQGGVGVDFGVDQHVDAATVILQGADGRPLAVGSRGHLADADGSFVVGYSGEAYIRHLKPENAVAVDLGDRDCTASFTYRPDGSRRVKVGPVTCQ